MADNVVKVTREERKALTRRRLLDAAARVVERIGFQHASVDEIVREAGLTKGALYSNFDDKDDLLAEVYLANSAPEPQLPRASLQEAADAFAASARGNAANWESLWLALDAVVWTINSSRVSERVRSVALARLAERADALQDFKDRLPTSSLQTATLMGAITWGLYVGRAALGPAVVPDDLFELGIRLVTGLQVEKT